MLPKRSTAIPNLAGEQGHPIGARETVGQEPSPADDGLFLLDPAALPVVQAVPTSTSGAVRAVLGPKT